MRISISNAPAMPADSTIDSVNPPEDASQAGVPVTVNAANGPEEDGVMPSGEESPGLVGPDQTSPLQGWGIAEPSPVDAPPSPLLGSPAVADVSSVPTTSLPPGAILAPPSPSSPPSVNASLPLVLLTSLTPSAASNTEPIAKTHSMDVDNMNSLALSAPALAATDVDSQSKTDQLDLDASSGTNCPQLDSTNVDDTSKNGAYQMAIDPPSGMDLPQLDSTNVDDPSKLPSWLSRNSMLDYLRHISEDKAWQQLVSSLVRFETVNTTTGVCN
jgi:hypothetical protein